MENDLLFSYPSALLDFVHTSDCSHAGGFVDFSTKFFSGSVLDTVSEDPIAELDDGELVASLDSLGFSCETRLASEKGRLLSSDLEDHNFDMLHDSVPNTPTSNLNGFCNPSLNLGQVLQTDELMPSLMEGGNIVNALGSWTTNSARVGPTGTKITIHQLNGLNLEEDKKNYSHRGLVERRDVPPPGTYSTVSTPELTLLEQAAASEPGLIVSRFLLPLKPDDDSQDVVSSVTAGLSNANSQGYEVNAIESPFANGDNTKVLRERMFTSAKDLNLDFSEPFRRVDLSGGSLSPLPLPIQIPQSRMIQRSLSSNALGQLGNVTYKERPAEGSMLAQVAPLYSSVKRPVVPPAHSKVQRTDEGQTSRTSFNCIRRVYSTGDLQTFNGMQVVQEGESPLNADCTILDERTFKIGRYTVEERKSRIHRYRQKRTERNFSKKIKYACRKTLADSRPRVRGRFAKNDETDDIFVKHNGLHNRDDEEEIRFQPSRGVFGYWLHDRVPPPVQLVTPLSLSSETR